MKVHGWKLSQNVPRIIQHWRIFHYSQPNTPNLRRVTIGFGLVFDNTSTQKHLNVSFYLLVVHKRPNK